MYKMSCLFVGYDRFTELCMRMYEIIHSDFAAPVIAIKSRGYELLFTSKFLEDMATPTFRTFFASVVRLDARGRIVISAYGTYIVARSKIPQYQYVPSPCARFMLMLEGWFQQQNKFTE